MSYLFDGSNTQGLYIDEAVVSAVPMWMAAAFTLDDFSQGSQFPLVCALGQSANNNNYRGMRTNTSQQFQALSRNASTSVTATSSPGITDNGWHVGVAMFESDALRRAERDGAFLGNNTTSNAPSAPARFVIGIAPALNAAAHKGKIAYVAIGSDILSAEDRALLGAGGDPRQVSSLVELWDFSSLTALIGLVGDRELTVLGSPSQITDNPAYSWLAANQGLSQALGRLDIEIQSHPNAYPAQVIEGQVMRLAVRALSTDLAATIPQSARYRIDSLDTGTAVAEWTSLDPSTSMGILVSSAQNARRTCYSRERRQILVEASDSDGPIRRAVEYDLVDLQGL